TIAASLSSDSVRNHCGWPEIRPAKKVQILRNRSRRRGSSVLATCLPRRLICDGFVSWDLGAEEDVFAVEHADGPENGDSGVNAGHAKNCGDENPRIRAGHDFFADQAGVEDGN